MHDGPLGGGDKNLSQIEKPKKEPMNPFTELVSEKPTKEDFTWGFFCIFIGTYTALLVVIFIFIACLPWEDFYVKRQTCTWVDSLGPRVEKTRIFSNNALHDLLTSGPIHEITCEKAYRKLNWKFLWSEE